MKDKKVKKIRESWKRNISLIRKEKEKIDTKIIKFQERWREVEEIGKAYDRVDQDVLKNIVPRNFRIGFLDNSGDGHEYTQNYEDVEDNKNYEKEKVFLTREGFGFQAFNSFTNTQVKRKDFINVKNKLGAVNLAIKVLEKRDRFQTTERSLKRLKKLRSWLEKIKDFMPEVKKSEKRITIMEGLVFEDVMNHHKRFEKSEGCKVVLDTTNIYIKIMDNKHQYMYKTVFIDSKKFEDEYVWLQLLNRRKEFVETCNEKVEEWIKETKTANAEFEKEFLTLLFSNNLKE